MKLHETANESTFHFYHRGRTFCSRSSSIKNLRFRRLVQLAEIGSADGVAHGDEHIRAGLDQYPFIHGHENLAVCCRFISENPRRDGGRAVEPMRRKTEQLQRSP